MLWWERQQQISAILQCRINQWVLYPMEFYGEKVKFSMETPWDSGRNTPWNFYATWAETLWTLHGDSRHLEHTANWRRRCKFTVNFSSTVKTFFISAIISWCSLLTSPNQWSLQWLCHLGHFKNSLDWLIDWLGFNGTNFNIEDALSILKLCLFDADEAADSGILVISDVVDGSANIRNSLLWLTCLLESASCAANTCRLAAIAVMQTIVGKKYRHYQLQYTVS